MSAFYSLVFKDRIEVLTDGAVYRDDGTLTDLREKVWRISTAAVPIGVFGVGETSIIGDLAKRVDAVAAGKSFDEVIAMVTGWFDIFGVDPAAIPPAQHFMCLFVGVSETLGPCQWLVRSFPVAGDGIPPLKLLRASNDMGSAPVVSPAKLAVAGVTLDKVQRGGLATVAVAMFGLFRRTMSKNPSRSDLPPHYGVGGHVDLTVITKKSMVTRRLHTWPQDRIGQKIDPARD